MTDLPIVMTKAGLLPQTPADLRAQLIALVTATNPGYPANLPGSLVEDIASTDTFAITLCDSARVELVNSVTPYGANSFILNQLGQVYGVQPGQESNTSVFVIFTGTPGFVISKGFTVSDGSHQYTVIDGGIVGTGGSSPQLFCVATTPGSWPVPADTVTTIITSVPGAITLSVTNPNTGIPAESVETEDQYRVRVLDAGLSPAMGMASYLKTLLRAIVGVQARLVSVRQVGGGWEVICGGGDPLEVAYGIFTALFDITALVGSSINVTNITNANPGVVTTDLNHGFSTGDVIQINGVVGMTGINGVNLTIAVTGEKSFTTGTNTTAAGAYVSGGVVTPNARNITASVIDYPDTYDITYVNPPMQTVVVQLVWNTTSPFAVSASAVAQLGAPAIIDYVNSIPVGLPINVFEMEAAFAAAISALFPTPLLSRMIWTISINGVSTAPTAGTFLVEGDPESYFQVASGDVAITQG